MHKTRGYKASAVLLKSIYEYIEQHVKNRTSMPIDVKKFLDEIKELPLDGEKTISPERAIKLRGALVAFLSIHSIEPSKEIEELLSGLKNIKTMGGAAASFYSDAIDEIYLTLERFSHREFSDAKLYFIDEHTKERFIAIESELNALLTTETQKRKLKFSKIVNFLNPDALCYKYSVSYVSKYQYISKEESLERYLPAHFEITLNKIEKEYRELLSAHTFSKEKKQQLVTKKEQEIQRAKDEYAYILKQLKESDAIDVKILSYEHASSYPRINFFIEKKNDKGDILRTTRRAHLRSEVVNVLWYQPAHLKRTNTVADILQNYNHAFGDVYYLENVKTINKKT